MFKIEDLVPDELNKYLNKKSLSTNLTPSEIQEEINQMEQYLNIPKTLPNFNGYLTVMSPTLSEPVRPSSSCPSDMARVKKLQGLNLTEDDIRLIVKDRQKKDNHNMSNSA